MVNAIYYARDVAGKPRGCDRGMLVEVRGGRGQWSERQKTEDSEQMSERGMRNAERGTRSPDSVPSAFSLQPSELLLITGPLALDWGRRKWGVLPRLENGAVTAANPMTPHRIRLWVRQNIHVRGRPEWTFVKVHTHGCGGGNVEAILGDAMKRSHDYLAARFNDGKNWCLHYVTAREMYNIIRAAEAGEAGDPNACRDFEIGPPAASAPRQSEGTSNSQHLTPNPQR